MSASEEIDLRVRSIRGISSLITRQLREGCLCSIHSNSFGLLLGRTFEQVHTSDLRVLSQADQVETSKALLAAFSCLKRLVQVYMKFDVPEDEEDETERTICKQLHEWILVMVK